MNKKRIFALTLSLVLLISACVVGGVVVYAQDTGSLPVATNGQQIDVWLIAGQSNAFGDALVENYPTDEVYSGYKTLLTNGASDVHHLYNSSTEFVPAAFGQGSQTHSGPEIGITTALSGKGKQNAIIKLAYGNTSLYNGTTSSEAIKYGTWTPPSYIQNHGINTDGNKVGDLYLSFILKVEEGIGKLVEAGYTPVIKGVWWMQGEADTFGAASSAAYAELLETLISDMRADLSEISGTNCSEMPFVYGRVLANSGYDIPAYITAVQAAQDEIAAKNLKNVYMIDTTKDLIDPATGTQRAPVQQDRWHYDSLSQQMIGEAFVRCVEGLDEVQTKYGYVPSEYSDASAYPFALFKKVEGNYTYAFDSAYASANYDALMTRAITLTKADGTATTGEAVILLRADADTKALPTYTSNIGETVTIDLGGYTLTARNSLCNTATMDCLAEGATEAKNGTINVKNGTLLMGNHGILYAAKPKSGSYTLEKRLTFNFENLNIGFADGASATCKTLLGIAYDSHVGDVVAKYEMNFVNCNIDAVTNCPTDSSFKLAKLAASSETAANGYNNAISITFKECVIKATSVDHLNIPMSPEGDSVTFLKGEDGTYGKVVLPTGTYANTYSGSDDGYATSVAYKATSTVTDGYTTYNLVGAGAVETPYGKIPEKYADANAYPFALFKDGDCIGAYATWKTAGPAAVAAIQGADTAGETVQILLRRDYANDNDTFTAFHKTAGNIVLDLGGNTFTRKKIIFDLTFQTIDGKTDGPIADTNIVVKNGEMLAHNGYIMTSAYVDNARLTAKVFNVTFEGVDFGYAIGATTTTPLYSIVHNNRTVKSGTVNITFDNCNFDLTTNAPAGKSCTWFNFKDPYDSVNIHATVKDGSFYASDFTKVNFSSLNDGNDSVTMLKDEDGNYTSFIMPITADEETLAAVGFNTPDGEMKYGKVETNGGSSTFALLKLDTEYGTVSYEYASPLDYPFAVFKDDECIGAYSTWASALNAAVSPIVGADTTGESVQILLRRDYTQRTSGDYANPFYQTAGSVVLDLNGNSFTGKRFIFDLTFHTVDKATDGPIAVSSSIVVKNGTLLVCEKSIIASAYADNARLTEKTYNITFEGVDFGYAGGATTTTPLYIINHNNRTVKSGTVNITFNNCNFDFTTNAPAGKSCTWFNFNDKYNSVNIHATVKGGSFYASDLTYVKFNNLNEGSDSVTYVKDDAGYYTTLEVPSETVLPELTINGGELKFVKVDSNSVTDIYRLRETAIADISFVPKASITLGSELVYNIYVPAVDYLKSFTVDGVSYEGLTPVTLDDGNSYYRIAIPMAASEAARAIKLVATISVGEKTATGTFTFSIPKYAEKVIASGNDVESQLVKDVLAYIRAAYVYFDAEGKDEALATIDAILGAYNSTFEKVSGETDTAEGLKSVTIVLEAKPVVRFVLPAGEAAENYTFSCGGRTLGYTTGTVTVGETEHVYVELELYAYQLIDEIEYTDGTYSGSFHINSYYDFVTTDEDYKDDANLITLVEKLYNYCKSAESYRASVAGN